MTALLLYGVVELEGSDGDSLASGTSIVAFRSLGAVVAPAQYVARAPDVTEVEAHRRVVESIFVKRPFLPAPIGLVFRSRDALVRWLELHSVTLTDGLGFVDGRVGGRLHLSRRTGDGLEAVDLPTKSADVFRQLRQHAAASVTLKPREAMRTVSAAFLVERDRWPTFVDLIAEQGRQHPELSFDQTGPWPPYDFVNMHFGS